MLVGVQQLQEQDAHEVWQGVGSSDVDATATTMSPLHAGQVVLNSAPHSQIKTPIQVAGEEESKEGITQQPRFTTLDANILPVAFDCDSRSLATLSYTWTHQAHGEVATCATIVSTDDANTQTKPVLFEPCCRGVGCQAIPNSVPPRLPRKEARNRWCNTMEPMKKSIATVRRLCGMLSRALTWPKLIRTFPWKERLNLLFTRFSLWAQPG
jgi:hypothetical protein